MSKLLDQHLQQLEPVVRIVKALHVVPTSYDFAPMQAYQQIFERWSAQVYDLGTQTVFTELGLPPTVLPPLVPTAPAVPPPSNLPPSTAIPVQPPPPASSRFVPVDALNWSRQRGELQGKWARDLDAQVKQVLSDGLEQGRSVPQLMSDLQGVFKDFSGPRLETIARTETGEAFNEGRAETVARINRAATSEDVAGAPAGSAPPRKRKPKGPYIVAAQYIGIGDARQTACCKSRNGRIILPGAPEAANGRPGLHYCCRTILRYISRLVYQKLEAGDVKTTQWAFSWTPAGGPKSLAEALDFSNVLPPMKGFGTAVVFCEPGRTLYSPDQPRDERGRWTTGGAGYAQAKDAATGGHGARSLNPERVSPELRAVPVPPADVDHVHDTMAKMDLPVDFDRQDVQAALQYLRGNKDDAGTYESKVAW